MMQNSQFLHLSILKSYFADKKVSKNKPKRPEFKVKKVDKRLQELFLTTELLGLRRNTLKKILKEMEMVHQ